MSELEARIEALERWNGEMQPLLTTHEICSERMGKRIKALEAAVIDALSSLVAAVSLLERGGRKGAPSDKMFAQMLIDYKNAIERTRSVLTQVCLSA